MSAVKQKQEKKKKEFKVSVKNLPQSPRKLRLVADTVRGKNAKVALDTLSFLNKKGARYVKKIVASGVANAKNMHGLKAEDLVLSEILVDEMSVKNFRRYKFVSRGRIARIVKRRSRIKLTLLEK